MHSMTVKIRKAISVVYCRAHGLTYNRFIQGLKAAGVEVDRRVLSDLATNDPATFKTLVDVARKSLIAL